MALGIDFLVALVEQAVSPISLRPDIQMMDKFRVYKIRARQRLKLLVTTLILLVAILFSFLSATTISGRSIVIGSKDFTEQSIIANLYATLIEENCDVQVDRKLDLGGTQIVFTALENGKVDLYIEYTGTLYRNIFKQTEDKDAAALYAFVQNRLRGEHNLQMLAPIGFNNTYALAVRKETAERYGLRTISDLAEVSRQLKASPTLEFMNRSDGMRELNYKVDVLKENPRDVAAQFLQERGLISSAG